MAGGEYIKFIPKLTKRELEVIEAILAGALRYKSIASSLNISVNTVKTHLRKIYQTVGVNNTEALASLFHGYSSNITDITPKSPQKIKKSPQIGDRNQPFFAVILYNIKHLGGKKMQNLKALRTRTVAIISLVSVIALVIGFMAIRTVSGNRQTNVDFKMIAESVPEGILLNFSNIPEDTYSLFISFWDITANGQIDDKTSDTNTASTNIYIYDNDLFRNELSKLKTSGKLICPFAKNGHEYSINVTVFTINDYENNFDEVKNPLTYSTNVIAGGGIYLTNTPSLNFTDENNTVTLSETPKFSKEVVYSPNGFYQFNNFVLIDGSSYGGGMSYWNELIYPARQILSGTQEHFGFKGNFPVNASVLSCLVVDDLEWFVLIAKAKENAIMSF